MTADVEKDGGFGLPSGATSGINSYDLEPRRRKAPKKKPETATKTQEESDVEKLKPSRGPQKRPVAPPQKPPRKAADMDMDTEAVVDRTDNDNGDEPSGEDAKKRGRGKTAVPPAKANLAPPFKKPGYGKADAPIDIALFEQPALQKFYDDHVEFFASGEYVRGVTDAASLGNLVSQLKSVTENFGKADQTITQELRDQSEELLETLTKMASESAGEEPSAEDIAIETQPTMEPGLDSDDVSGFAKSLRKSLGLAKSGARNSAQDQETIQKVHDASCELGADCGMNDSVDKHQEGKDMRKADTIMAEGNKRGAAVTDPSLPVNSNNAEWEDESSPQGQDKQPDPYATKKGKKRTMDMDMAAKGKKRTADMDDPEDDSTDDTDDEDDMEDDTPPKAKKAKKFDSDDLAKAVAAGVKAAFAEINGGSIQKGEAMTIPRVPPNLMAVGKGGELSKYVEVDLDTLKKSVAPVRGSSQAIAGDNDTARVIKAIHAGGATFRLNPNEIPS